MTIVVNNELVIVHENARVIDAVKRYLAEKKELNLGTISGVEDCFEHPISPYGSLNNGDTIKIRFK